MTSTSPDSFTAVLERLGDESVLRLAGELDLATVPEAEAAMERARSEPLRPLKLDLSRLTFVDSSGLRLIMELAGACRAEGRRLSIAAGPRMVQRVFEVAGVLDVLPFEKPDR